MNKIKNCLIIVILFLTCVFIGYEIVDRALIDRAGIATYGHRSWYIAKEMRR